MSKRPMWFTRHTALKLPSAATRALTVAAQRQCVWWPRRSISTTVPAGAPVTWPEMRRCPRSSAEARVEIDMPWPLALTKPLAPPPVLAGGGGASPPPPEDAAASDGSAPRPPTARARTAP
ncbi:MAG TPA: hypothetical protein VE992_04205 [Solirubrobacteraceae bacterium]|nr:hypothetical protein [Solirubrobacteraceae bacterium]